MKTLPADLEALMPEPAAHRYMSHGHSSRWQLAGRSVPPGADPLFTADQVREAMLAATERAAKECEVRALAYRIARAPGWHEVDHECTQCAAAIRSGGEAGS